MLIPTQDKLEGNKEYILISEINVVVALFQCVPTGMITYFIIYAQPEGVNKNKDTEKKSWRNFLKLPPI